MKPIWTKTVSFLKFVCRVVAFIVADQKSK